MTTLPAKFARLSGASLLWLFVVCVFAPTGFAQSARDTVLEVTATTNVSAPCVTLNWPAGTNVTAQKLWRRVKGVASWGTAITLGAGDTSYPDMSAQPGLAYEYSLQRTRSTAPTTVYGGIVSGVNIPLVESRGNVCLLVDTTMATALAPELTQLEKNLVSDGWTVFRHDVPRQVIAASSAVPAEFPTRIAEQSNIRSIVQADYSTAPTAEWALLILGRVPVPYAGSIAPDGHGDHIGAWPTDGYYADVNGTWNDVSINNTGASDARNDNIPGDGKFDNGTFPSALEMQAGRVDMANMTGVPTGQTEVGLLRQYLVRDHRFRRGLAPYNTVAARALIDDGFGYFSGEVFSHSSWRAAISFFGRSAGQVDALDWFGTLGTTPILFAYGCGGGSYTSAGGVGTSTLDFGRKDSKGVFCGLFGSYFGDWDVTNNFLRSPLAGTQDSLGLTNAWSGRSQVHYHHMALGETVGYCMRYTQNANSSTFNGDWFQNNNAKGVQMNLMGDPTLRLHTVRPGAGLVATSNGANVLLTWQPSPDTVAGYHVYRATSASGPFTRISGVATSATNPLGDPGSSPTFTDTTASSGTTYHYRVTAVRLQTSMSGSYANQSCGELVSIIHGGTTPAPPTRLAASGTGTTSYNLTWDDNATNETGYEVQRRNPANGVWSTIATPAAGSTSFADSGATAGGPNHYRVRALGASGNSTFTNEVSDPNQPGIARIAQDYVLVSKTAGTLAHGVLRFSGTHGAGGVNRVTSHILSNDGDFSGGTGTVNWTHAQSGTQNSTFTITNHGGPQFTKVFRVDINTPSGVALGSPSTAYVQIFDPTTRDVVPFGWQSSAVGSVTQAGYGEYYDGIFGISAVTGNIAGAADSYRGFHQQVTGDCRIAARIVERSAAAGSTRAGIMIRSALTEDAVMCAAITTSATAIQRAYRTAIDGGADTALTQGSLALPLWLRLTRSGSNVSLERSSDGANWTAFGAAIALNNLTTSAFVSLVMASNTSAPEIYGVAQFDNVTVDITPAPPAPVAASGELPGQIYMSWPWSNGAETYTIERSTTSGSGFIEVGQVAAATSFTDSNLTVGQTYYYRVRAGNAVFASGPGAETSAQPLNPPTVAGWRYRQFGTTANTGNAADTSDPDKDGLKNLIECVLGQSPFVASSQALAGGTINISGSNYLTLTFVYDPSVSGVQFRAESAADVGGTWMNFDPLLPANQVSVQNNVPSPGLQTIKIKDVQAIPAGGKRFLRLHATRP